MKNTEKNTARGKVEEWTEKLREADSNLDIYDIFGEISSIYRYKFYIFMRANKSPLATLYNSTMLTNWSRNALLAFDKFELFNKMSVVPWFQNRTLPFAWNAHEVLADILEDEAKSVLYRFEEIQHADGLLVPLHAGRGGALSLSGAKEKPPFEARVDLFWLASAAHQRLLELNVEFGDPPVDITERERDCIYWTAAGKTSSEIATIMGISAHTVDHYMNSAGQKLNAPNRASTVVAALRLRIID